MKRLLLNLLTTLSLLLLLLTLTESIRSYYVVDEFGLGALKSPADHRITMFTAYTASGKIYLFKENLRFVDVARSPNTRADYFSANFWKINFSHMTRPQYFEELVNFPKFAGFGYRHQPTFPIWRSTAEKSVTQIFIPLYLPALLFSLLPLHFLNRLRKARSRKTRLAKNLCPTCSYDLRASKSRCPECGTPIPSSPPSPPR